MANTKTPPPVIKNDKDNPIQDEIIAQAIIDVAAAAKKLNGSKLKRRAVALLIRDASGNSVTLTQIEAVLNNAAELDKKYIKAF